MLFLIKNDSKKYAYDSVSGACIPLTSLQSKIYENIDFPLKPVCPTSIRYALAKYDAGDVRRAYSFIYGLYEKNLINDSGDKENASLLLCGEYSFPSEELAKTAINEIYEKFGQNAKISFCGTCGFASKLENIIK